MLSREIIASLERFGIGALGPASRVSGGDISRAYRVETSKGPIFVKLEPREEAARLDAEAEGLEAISRTHAVAVPAVLARGVAGAHAFLALEWLSLGAKSVAVERRLGAALAAMHATTSERFGWPSDNYIGRTPQPNAPTSSWVEFFRERRLRPQLTLAARSGIGNAIVARGETLLANLDALLADHSPVPSLVHGDLWGGNWGASTDGTPYLFDPAIHYADREVDLAMTRLFGGFGDAFYRAYDEAWPPAPGRERRVDLYNLYHLLNHFNSFGAGYRSAVAACIERVLALLP